MRVSRSQARLAGDARGEGRVVGRAHPLGHDGPRVGLDLEVVGQGGVAADEDLERVPQVAGRGGERRLGGVVEGHVEVDPPRPLGPTRARVEGTGAPEGVAEVVAGAQRGVLARPGGPGLVQEAVLVEGGQRLPGRVVPGVLDVEGGRHLGLDDPAPGGGQARDRDGRVLEADGEVAQVEADAEDVLVPAHHPVDEPRSSSR